MFETKPYEIFVGNCIDVLKTLEDSSIDSIVTDPPYGLSFMGKRWDYDVPSEEIWCECLRVLKPGGYLLAFAGTRTQHRMAVRIEDAGFEIRDMIAWVYGSGFPKSMDVSKAIDKAADIEGTFGAPKSAAHAGWIDRGRMRGENGHEGYQRPWMTDEQAVDKNARQYVGGSEESRQWQGWGTALKPALEPITVARKPLIGTVAENVLAHRTGALNIDGCRVELNGDYKCKANGRPSQTGLPDNYDPSAANQPDTVGRWPANLIHDGSDEVLELFPKSNSSRESGNPNHIATSYGKGDGKETHDYRDTRSAARFFYCAKASKKERNVGLNSSNDHPTVKPIELMKYLCRLVTPLDGIILDPFVGSGSTGCAAVDEKFRFIGIEMNEEYVDIANKRIDYYARGERTVVEKSVVEKQLQEQPRAKLVFE